MAAGLAFPPFPDDIPTHPLLVIDYDLIKANDPHEIDRLWEAATKLGFWYLKNHGTDAEAQGMFEMGAETMSLPSEEKLKFDQGDQGRSFGYKAAGVFAVDLQGKRDTVEFLNIAKNDVLAWPHMVHRDYPSTVNARMESTIKPFVTKSVEITSRIIDVFNDRLGLPKGALSKRHLSTEKSGCEARCVKSAPCPDAPADKVALTPHTDFGSLSFLHNRTGGLQVMLPGTQDWQYIKPIPDYAICNIGDALSLMSGGILCSCMHRVVAPREQAKFERWSLVYFSRPYETVQLNALTDESRMIAEAVAASPDPSKYHSNQTAKQWVARRNKYHRPTNWTHTESWKASQGTEHIEVRSYEVKAY